MGKKDKNKKKGKGAEKTAAKTEKKMSQKQKKEIAALGEDNIENIVAQIEQEERKRLQVVETVVLPPSRRVNFTLTAHPDKEELILFGGEYFNGQKTYLYNDLFFYNIARNEWMLVKAPGSPPPRCGHQTVALAAGKGQLWVFGGEYASPTQAQFYHYRDLWVYHLATKTWEKIGAAGGPSARSGHRMVCLKKQLVVFGGFHDNLRDYKYFNDVYAFDLENYSWKKLEPTGTAPAPRSGCQMVALSDGKVLVYGGYSKERIKKDVDKGTVHTDLFLLTPEKNDVTGLRWKWTSVKQTGMRLSPRCGISLAIGPNNRAFTFGGVWDVEESEEDLAGTFYNDLQVLDLDKSTWRNVTLSGKRDNKSKRKRRKEKDIVNEKSEESDDLEEDMMETNETNSGGEATGVPKMTVGSSDGVFTMTLGQTPSGSYIQTPGASCSQEVFMPSPRMNCGLVVKHGVLYLYGGIVEDGDKQFTLSDFYSLDVHKLDEWKTIIQSDLATQEWLDSDSESGSDSESESESESESSKEEEAMETN